MPDPPRLPLTGGLRERLAQNPAGYAEEIVMNITADNMQDVLDSRDIIARIEELENDEERTDEDNAELSMLNALAEEASASPDWKYGETLIRDSYFTKYAQELAEDCGMVDQEVSSKWPYTCIDWDHAAHELKMDYTCVDFGGIDYWIRS